MPIIGTFLKLRGFSCAGDFSANERFRCDPNHRDAVRHNGNDRRRRGLYGSLTVWPPPLSARPVASFERSATGGDPAAPERDNVVRTAKWRKDMREQMRMI